MSIIAGRGRDFTVSGPADSGLTIMGGGFAELFPGETIVPDGGRIDALSAPANTDRRLQPDASTIVSSGKTVSGAVISGGSTQTVLAGGKTIGTVVSSGGAQTVSSGGKATGTVVSSGGAQEVFGNAVGTTVSGRTAFQVI